jgi:hypothetical protein
MIKAEKPKISLIRILLNDYLAFLPLLFALVCWVLYLILYAGQDLPDVRVPGRTIPHQDAHFFLWIAVVLSFLGALVAVWRIRFIRRVFSQGIDVKGKIVKIKKIRARGLETSSRVIFRYHFGGKEFTKSNWFLSWDMEKQPGDSITIVLLSDKPARALIRDAFVSV